MPLEDDTSFFSYLAGFHGLIAPLLLWHSEYYRKRSLLPSKFFRVHVMLIDHSRKFWGCKALENMATSRLRLERWNGERDGRHLRKFPIDADCLY